MFSFDTMAEKKNKKISFDTMAEKIIVKKDNGKGNQNFKIVLIFIYKPMVLGWVFDLIFRPSEGNKKSDEREK